MEGGHADTLSEDDGLIFHQTHAQPIGGEQGTPIKGKTSDKMQHQAHFNEKETGRNLQLKSELFQEARVGKLGVRKWLQKFQQDLRG